VKRNVVGTSLLMLVPLAIGGLIGYNMGHSVAESGPSGKQPLIATEAVWTSAREARGDSDQATITGSRQTAITRAVAQASDAVVGINVLEMRQVRGLSPWGDDPFFRHFFGDQVYTQQVQELGSGFLISPDGYILTNDHVAGNATQITVTMVGGKKYEAQLIGSDMLSDIALLKIEGKDLPYLPLGSSEDVIIGEWVIALGNPFGLFEVNDKPTVTVGVVSATAMNLRAQEGRVYRGMIQTDAAINSGNSGGPLINSLGEVIGVNAVIYTPNQGNIGLGFAIPITRVKTILDALKRYGKVEREFWTGLSVQAVDRRIARYFGLDQVRGVIITRIAAKSPAERGGFRVEDIILEARGERIDDEYTLIAILDEAQEGEEIPLTVFRSGKTLQLKLRLQRRTT
jgi:serine protease Do